MLSKKLRLFHIAIALSCLVLKSAAQEHYPHQTASARKVLAEELHTQNIYTIAAAQAQQWLQQPHSALEGIPWIETERADYLKSTANIALERVGATEEAKKHIAHSHDEAQKQRLALALAKHFFHHQKMQEAITYYEIAGVDNLTNEEIPAAKFELAYAYLVNKDFEKAENIFGNIRNAGGQYATDAQYYFGLLSYNRGNYDFALQSFEAVKDQPRYKYVVPYYMAEIHYYKGDKQASLQLAQTLLNQESKNYFYKELNLLVAQIFYEQGQYTQALPHFEYYYDHSEKVRKDQLYEMGFANYQVGQYAKAIDRLTMLSNEQDSLGQAAMFLLGASYLKTDKKQSAKNAFNAAAAMSYNKLQQEAALFTAGKLAYELGHYSEAANLLRELQVLYPNTTYKVEATTLLSDLLARTNNYEEGYKLLKSIESSDAQYRRSLQRLAYGYGIKQWQNEKPMEAQQLLTEAAQLNADNNYTAASHFWLGEIAYQNQNYQQAIDYHKAYLSHNVNNGATVSETATKGNAYNTMGYAAMQMKEYSQAQQYFNAAKENAASVTAATSALVRAADAALMKKDYDLALRLYDSTIAAKTTDADYALLQRATLLGLKNNTAEQITTLQSLINKKPTSAFASDARYELANTYVVAGKYAQAIAQLNVLVDGKSSYASRALLKKGFALQQLNKDEEAIATYKELLKNYATSDEKSQAIEALKSIYIEQNKPAELAKVLQELTVVPNEKNTLDSVFYHAAINQYANGSYAKAQEGFEQYLKNYPQGNFTLKAAYYAAESAYQNKKWTQALQHFETVLSSGDNEYTLTAAKKAAPLAANLKDEQNSNRYYHIVLQKAEQESDKLMAWQALMQQAHRQQKDSLAATFADSILATNTATKELHTEAQFFKAKHLQNQKQYEEALALYKNSSSSKNANVGPESIFRIGEVLYLQNKIAEAETYAASSLKQLSGYDYWEVKTFLLLSDILIYQKDWFNAKATLQSLIKNAKDAQLKAEAKNKLNIVLAKEKEQSKLGEK